MIRSGANIKTFFIYIEKSIRLFLFLPVVLLGSLSACVPQRPGTEVRAPADPVPPVSPGGAKAPVLEGTASGGGGNGLQGSALETYARKIDTLPEFRKYIQPILRRMSRGEPDVFVAYLNWSVSHKAWYFVPAELPILSKEQTALHFDTEQLAINLDKSVLINSNLYSDPKKSAKNRAFLLLHEMVMSARLLMKQPPKIQCEALASSAYLSNCDSEEVLKLAKAKNYDEQSRKSADGSDHEAVRLMTIHLMERDQDFSGAHISRFRRGLGFDFPWDRAVSSAGLNEVLKAMERSRLAGDVFLASNVSPDFLSDFLGEEKLEEAEKIVCRFVLEYRTSSFAAIGARFARSAVPKAGAGNSTVTESGMGGLMIMAYDSKREAQGVLDPRGGEGVVDRVRFLPEQQVGQSMHGQKSFIVDFFLSREEGPRLIAVDFHAVRYMLEPTVANGSVISNDNGTQDPRRPHVPTKAELVPLRMKPFRCLVSETN